MVRKPARLLNSHYMRPGMREKVATDFTKAEAARKGGS